MSITEQMRRLAFDVLYLLPEATEKGGPDGAEELAALPPDQRGRVMRIASRRLALQILFQMDARGVHDPAFVKSTLATVDGLGPIAAAEIEAMVVGADGRRHKADALFRELAPEWPTHRLAGVDRALLRLGYHEIVEGKTPAAIILNEAVELAKHFSTERSPAFINALLDKAAQRMAAPAGGPV